MSRFVTVNNDPYHQQHVTMNKITLLTIWTSTWYAVNDGAMKIYIDVIFLYLIFILYMNYVFLPRQDVSLYDRRYVLLSSIHEATLF